ncbi:MAG: hypothetical protein WA865_17395 [Spirulinaceae cyanobacterium]
MLNGTDLVKLDFEGNLLWCCPHDYGFWGSPVHLKDNWLVCASSDNKVHLIDQAGKIIRTTNLPTSVSTEILVSSSGDLWFGMGAAECAVTRIDPNGDIAYTQYVARDQGLRHPLTMAGKGNLWAATDQGLVCLNARSGKIVLWKNAEKDGFRCISGALLCSNELLVVTVTPEHSCFVTRVAIDGTVVAQYPLPPLLRAKLLSASRGGIWLVGSTVSPWEPPLDSDQTFIACLTENESPEIVTKVEGQRAIEATLDSDGTLWVGTYTYNDDDDSESGELLLYKNPTVPYAKWTPDPPTGVGVPVFSSNGNGVVATSKALVGFSLVE